MNIVLLITATFTLALVHGQRPCLHRTSSRVQDEFLVKHVLYTSAPADKTSTKDWADYLNGKGLCGRERVQTFMPMTAMYKELCTPDSFHYGGHLCLSNGKMDVYDVESEKKGEECEVKVTPVKKYVVVGCTLMGTNGNRCEPMHFETSFDTVDTTGLGKCQRNP